MRSADRTLSDLASSVADGDSVDWPGVRARVRSPDAMRIASGIETISRLSAIEPGAAVAARDAAGRLPAVLEAARAGAKVCLLPGVVGHTLALANGMHRAAVLLALMAAFAGAAVFLDRAGLDRRARALGACYWMAAASIGGGGLAFAAAQASHFALSLAASLRPEALFAAGLWQFAREFPSLTRFSRLDSWCTALLYVSGGTGLGLVLVNLLPAVLPPLAAAPWIAPLLRYPGSGFWYWIILFALALPALIVMAARARLTSEPERRRARLFLMTFAGVFGLLVVEVLAEALIPSFGALMQTPTGRWWGGVMIYGSQLALPIVTAYVVVTSDVFTVRVIVHRALRYLLARTLIVGAAVLPLLALAGYLFAHRGEPLAEALATAQAVTLVWAAAAAVMLAILRPQLIRVLDRWALPGLETPAVMLAALSERMKQARTPVEVITMLAAAIERAFQAPAHAWAARDGRLVPVHTPGKALPEDSLIPVLLAGANEPCVVAPRHRQSYHDLLMGRDQVWVVSQNIEVLAPVSAGRHSRTLIGAVAVEARRNALSFSPDDLRFLTAGCAAAGLACDALQAEADPRGRDAPESAEFAIECAGCGRVSPWNDVVAGPCACGGSRRPAALPKVLASRFEITARLGAGGMGVVYRATDRSLGRDVAIKSLTRLTEDAAARLTAEARTMAGLSHAHVAVLYGIETWRGTPLLVIEYLPGGTLAARLRRGPIALADALAVLHPLAEALEHMHQAGFVHGDIKPSNIAFSEAGVPKFLDFGLSRAVARAGPAAAGLVADDGAALGGTPAYLSPEVREGASAGPLLDLWALCLVLWESVTGRHPLLHAATRAEVVRALRERAADLEGLVPEAVRRVLVQGLSIEPDRRPQSARALMTAIETAHGRTA